MDPVLFLYLELPCMWLALSVLLYRGCCRCHYISHLYLSSLTSSSLYILHEWYWRSLWPSRGQYWWCLSSRSVHRALDIFCSGEASLWCILVFSFDSELLSGNVTRLIHNLVALSVSVGNSTFFTRKYALFDYIIVKLDTLTCLFWWRGPKPRTATGQIWGKNTTAIPFPTLLLKCIIIVLSSSNVTLLRFCHRMALSIMAWILSLFSSPDWPVTYAL